MEIGMRYVFAGVGLLLCLIGNYMHTIKPNYFAGLRLPWTLNNEDNWRKTHLLAGKLWFVGGLVIAILCLTASGYRCDDHIFHNNRCADLRACDLFLSLV